MENSFKTAVYGVKTSFYLLSWRTGSFEPVGTYTFEELAEEIPKVCCLSNPRTKAVVDALKEHGNRQIKIKKGFAIILSEGE